MWTVLKGAAFTIAVAVFLAFVGAFGTEAVPILPRYLLFVTISLLCAGVATGALALSACVSALNQRPWMRQAFVLALVAPGTAVVVWAVVGFIVVGGPKLATFPAYLAPSFAMTLAMSALSQAVFRRRTPTTSARAPTASVRFLDRLPPAQRGAAVYAVQAEDHYVRVHTDRGAPLLLLRLADAVAELEGVEGARVHRSWWVAKSAVAGTARRGSAAVLELCNGAVVPVSRRQIAELKRAGWF